jgi:hypothetical protein
VFSSFLAADGKCSYATGLQLSGVLDELFAYDGPLGAHYSEDAVSLYLWAPTAQVYDISQQILYGQFVFCQAVFFYTVSHVFFFLLQNRQCVPVFTRMRTAGIPWKLFS